MGRLPYYYIIVRGHMLVLHRIVKHYAKILILVIQKVPKTSGLTKLGSNAFISGAGRYSKVEDR